MVLLLLIDDKTTRILVKNQVKDIQGIGTILESNSAEDALFQIMEKKPQLVISSDHLPGKSGFELVNLLYENDIEIPFIILSNDQSKVVDAIRHHVYEFLVYPYPVEKLKSTVSKAILELEEKYSEVVMIQDRKTRLRINSQEGFRLFDLDLLTHCIADGSYTNLFFSNGNEIFTSSYLGKIEKVLKEYKFVRINRSTIINLYKIKEIDRKRGICRMDTGTDKNEFKITKFCLKKLEEDNLI
jgi:two-component system, LytTR family, response regulator